MEALYFVSCVSSRSNGRITMEDDELIAAAELGDEARKFLESDLGRCLIGMARQEVQMAQEKLIDVDPGDMRAVRTLQNQARVGRWFEEWINELLSRGENSLSVFKQQQET